MFSGRFDREYKSLPIFAVPERSDQIILKKQEEVYRVTGAD